MALRKPTKAASAEGSDGSEAKDPTLMAFPTVWEFLTTGKYDDGSARQLSALSVFVEDGSVKVALNDKEERRSAYTSGATLRDALNALEAKLSDGDADWRAWGKATRKK